MNKRIIFREFFDIEVADFPGEYSRQVSNLSRNEGNIKYNDKNNVSEHDGDVDIDDNDILYGFLGYSDLSVGNMGTCAHV